MTDADCTESMDVLLLAEDFYPKTSGGAFIDWNVAKHLSNAGDSITVVTPRNEKTKRSETVEGIEIRRPFRGPNSDTHSTSVIGLLRRILFISLAVPYLLYLGWHRNFDIVYSTNHICHSPAALFSTVFRTKHVSFVGFTPSIKPYVSLADPLVVLERINFRLFMGDLIICQTPEVFHKLSGLSNCKVERIDGIIDKEAVKATVNSDTNTVSDLNNRSDVQLIYVGRLVEIKNPSKLPVLIRQLPSEYSLQIVGDGPQRSELEKVVERTGVSDRIDIAGQLPHRDTLQAIHRSNVLLLPSKTESYGAVVFEALSLNTPVLATPVGVLPTIDHPKLITVPLEDFLDELLNMNVESELGVDEEVLHQFSVKQFAHRVRENMLLAT